jgi:hypothetical protein
MKLSLNAQKELLDLAKSDSFRREMDSLRSRWQTYFIKAGEVDVDVYIEFVTQFNEFVNHQPKPFRKMIDKEMKL